MPPAALRPALPTEGAAAPFCQGVEGARVTQVMSACSAVLEAVGEQKVAQQTRRAKASGTMRTLLERQVEILTIQEVAILEKAGVPNVTAKNVLVAVDAAPGVRTAGGGGVLRRRARSPTAA